MSEFEDMKMQLETKIAHAKEKVAAAEAAVERLKEELAAGRQALIDARNDALQLERVERALQPAKKRARRTKAEMAASEAA